MTCEHCKRPLQCAPLYELCGQIVCAACFAAWEPDPIDGPPSSVGWGRRPRLRGLPDASGEIGGDNG